MKTNKPALSISALLGRYYLAFTLILIIIFYCTYSFWDTMSRRLVKDPDIQGLLDSAHFKSGSYQDVDAAGFLGDGGGFAVLDRQLRPIYSSSDNIPPVDTEDELLCIGNYQDMELFGSLAFQTETGENRLLISRERYSRDGMPDTKAAVLDENGLVLEGSLFPGKRQFSREELGYLTGSWSQDFNLERCSARSPAGEELNVLLLLPKYSEAHYEAAFIKAGRLWLLAIPLYLAATLVFVRLLDRHFRRPLSRLKAATLRLGAGEPPDAGDCGGPAELQELGRSFDRMARTLAESRAETQRLEQQRSKMLADISHDLKTPVTVLSGYANLIRDGRISQEDLPGYLDTMVKKSEALAGLINSFCQYAQTEHPDFRLEEQEAELCEFVREYLAERFGEIELAGCSLAADIPEELLLPCRLDPFQLRRALDNILSNALKHNPAGTLIRVSLRREGSRALLTLADNGKGIPEALRGELFTPFAVGDKSRSKGGSGLGLAISAKIIRAHGWSIGLLDGDGGGAAFEIGIPL